MTMWEELTTSFSHTFSFAEKNSFICSALQDNYDTLLEIVVTERLTRLQWISAPQMMMECYNVLAEPHNEDDLIFVYIPDSEISRDIEIP